MRFLIITAIFLLSFQINWICAQSSLPIEDQQKINELFKGYENIPGLALGIYNKGEVLFQKGYGFANLDYNIPIEPKTVFDLASTSKQFTAACIILLENENKLSLDDPIQTYLPEFPSYKEGNITVRHLLNHTSGLREYLALQHFKGESWDNNYDTHSAFNLIKTQKELNFIPGSQYSYSNSGYVLLSIIVERISGMSLGKFAQKNIFTPLQMGNTFFYEDPTIVVKNRAIGYNNDDNQFKRSHYFNVTVTGDGGVYSTINDLKKWGDNLKESKIGNESFIEKMLLKGTLNNGKEIIAASGLFIDDYLGLSTIGHFGNWAGFNSLFFNFPTEDLTIIILGNNADLNVRFALDQLTRIILKDELSTIEPANNIGEKLKTIKLSDRELEKFTGHYFNETNGDRKEIIVKNDTLVYRRVSNRETKLIPISKNKFIFLGAPQVLVSFGEGKKAMQLTIGEESPLNFTNYQPKEYSEKGLTKYTGSYYSPELAVTYKFFIKLGALTVSVNNKELVSFRPIMNHVFNDVEGHFGYIKFTTTEDGSISSFTITDNTAKNLYFEKMR